MRMRAGKLAACLVVVGMLATTAKGVRLDDDPAKTPKSNPARFDLDVREDFFAGFEGDRERLEAGMKKCEEVIAEDSKHAEAMVWLGAGEVFLSGQSFQKGDVAKGMTTSAF